MTTQTPTPTPTQSTTEQLYQPIAIDSAESIPSSDTPQSSQCMEMFSAPTPLAPEHGPQPTSR